MATTSTTSSASLTIRGIQDLNLILQETWNNDDKIAEELIFDITSGEDGEAGQSSVDYAALVELLRSTASSHFKDISRVRVDVKFNWTATYARDFTLIVASLPKLKQFVWTSRNGTTSSQTPITHLTILLETCPGLEYLIVEGIKFITSAVAYDGSSLFSVSMGHFCDALKEHSSLRDFQCAYCLMGTVGGDRDFEMAHSSRKTITEWWVDEMLTGLGYIQSLECISIIASPSSDAPNRILLGLCKHGDLTIPAVERLQAMLLEEHAQDRRTYQKVRLWMAHTYKTKKDSQLLLDLCHALARNSEIEDFRVRGSEETALKFVTPAVIEAFQELLGSTGDPQNFKLTSCDLIQKQGSLVDFYCKLNRMGRGDFWQRLPTVTRQQWVQEVLIQYQDDMDVLFYWNRVYPLFLASVSFT